MIILSEMAQYLLKGSTKNAMMQLMPWVSENIISLGIFRY